jgi:hypothetical protein
VTELSLKKETSSPLKMDKKPLLKSEYCINETKENRSLESHTKIGYGIIPTKILSLESLSQSPTKITNVS